MNIKDNIDTVVVEVVKATPASATLTLTMFGVPLTQWAAILSILVLLLQAYFLIRNNLGEKHDRNKERPSGGINRSSEPDRRVDAD